jgi:hypothetical protein
MDRPTRHGSKERVRAGTALVAVELDTLVLADTKRIQDAKSATANSRATPVL